jgi:hypothetical protein
VGLVAYTCAVAAHHSIAGVYDNARQLTIEGAVHEFAFVNPHPFITLEVRNGDRAARWTLEMDNRRELVELGFRADTLRPGDRLVITGSAARRDPLALYVRRLERPADGFTYEHHR